MKNRSGFTEMEYHWQSQRVWLKPWTWLNDYSYLVIDSVKVIQPSYMSEIHLKGDRDNGTE